MREKPLPLELWGGVECTIVRLGDDYRDQSEETGHSRRPQDIDLLADLGVKTVRYPILWEKVAPERPDRLDFSWTDERLAMLRERGIAVIGGLLHHTPISSIPIFRTSSPIMRPGSPIAIPGSAAGPRSTSRSPPRASPAFTAIGTRTGATIRPSSNAWPTSAAAPWRR
jgi:hypothetical protein